MTAAIYTSDTDRERAIELRRLLICLLNGTGEDRPLGVDIAEALGASTYAPNATSSIDGALTLAEHVRLCRAEVIALATRRINDKVRAGGWKLVAAVDASDFARQITGIILLTEIVRLERKPL